MKLRLAILLSLLTALLNNSEFLFNH